MEIQNAKFMNSAGLTIRDIFAIIYPMTRKTKIIISVSAIIVLGIVFFLGLYTGSQMRPEESKIVTVCDKDSVKAGMVDFSPFWKVWNELDEKYIYSASTTDQDKVWGAIQGLAESTGDPYTTFFPPADASIFEGDIAGTFEGVGMEIGIRDDILTVISPLKGSPAEKAGVRAGDKILKIDDKITMDMSGDDAVKLIRGKGGTKVDLTLLRGDKKEPIVITVTRGKIDVPTIETEKRKDGIFIVRLFSFSEQSPTLFRNALREFIVWSEEKPENTKLILDLRGNPGGYLDAAVSMASWFLPSGKVIVKEDYGKKGTGPIHRSQGYDIFNENLKFVILVDGGSASASEILAGALSDHDVAKLVGAKTFGKGSVQEVVPITENTVLKVTVAEWLTPNGKSISHNGIVPDYEVKMTQEEFDKGKDPQLDKAVSVLKNWK
ncbi:MAG: S41 family peptidase [Candidatus Paceibacterota bacterium]|jgi:carboxyl-terminal processing protease|nr:S41 family peptidase [Candidatus Paceibacterota bacterium]